MTLLTTPGPVSDVIENQIALDGYKELFRNQKFVALWVGQVFSQLADRIIFVLFIALIVKNYGTLGSYKSMLYIAFTIPAILLTAIAGVFIDRVRNQHVLIISNLVRAGVLALTGFIVSSGSLVMIYLAAFGISIATQFFAPAESATIPTVTPKSQLLVANSLFTTTMMASIVFGFALGDPLIAWLGLAHAHWAIVALFLLSSVALCFVQTPAPKTTEKLTSGAFISIFEELADGFRYLMGERVLLKRMLKLTVLFSYVVAMGILFISYAEAWVYDDPVVASQKFAWLITASGLGMLLGSVLIGHYFRTASKNKLVLIGFLIVGACFLLLAATPLVPTISNIAPLNQVIPLATVRGFFAHCVAGVMGIGAAMVAVPLQSMVHSMVPEANRGRLMGIQFTLLSTASTLPAVIAGVGADLIGVIPIFIVLSVPLLVLGGRGLSQLSEVELL